MDRQNAFWKDAQFKKKWETQATFPDSHFTVSFMIDIHRMEYGMTAEEERAFRKWWNVSGELAKQYNENLYKAELRQLKNPEDIKTQLITISIDQKLPHDKAVETQRKVIEKIKSANYKFIQNGIYTFEYYSTNGWNPHIHIKIDKTQKGATVAQIIRRKLETIKAVYAVNITARNDEIHQAYIMGDKTDRKRENCEMDKIIRDEYKLEDYYIMN